MEKPSLWRAIATRERLGWVMYDWADSAFVLCVITVIGSAYFVGVFESAAEREGGLLVGEAQALSIGGLAVTAEAAWSFLIAASALIVAGVSPFLGAISDAIGARRRFMQGFCALGVAATAALWWEQPWWLVGILILLGNVGFEGSGVFYNAYLPDIAPPNEQDLVSSWGYGLGYIGGVIVLIAALMFLVPHALVAQLGQVRDAFLVVALWWGGFALITFWALPESRPRHGLGESGLGQSGPGLSGSVLSGAVLSGAWRELVTTVSHIRRYPNAGWFLLAFLFYNDGIATLISNATPFALQNIYVDESLSEKVGLTQLIPAIILVQLVAFPGSLFCGWLATRFGEKRTIFLTLMVFAAVLAYGQVIRLVSEFYVMAGLIGLVLGGYQAISRSLFASLIPPGKNAEFFAFFALSAKFSAMFGPLVYGVMLLLTGSTRTSLLSLLAFFGLGAAVLLIVDVKAGRQQARA